MSKRGLDGGRLKTLFMPYPREILEFIQYVPSVVHEALHNSSGPPTVFQLFWAQFVVQLPSSKEAFKLGSW